MIAPPINPNIDGLSLTNIKAQIGPKTDSDNIIIPTIAEGVVLAPVVINMNPKPTWKHPARKPKKISWGEIIIFVERKKPIKHEHIPATNCAGTISTVGYFLTIIINIAKVIGIVKAARFPDNSPGVNEFPTINKTPVIAKIMDVNVIAEIFSFRKKYPNIARNRIWSDIIKLVFATVVLYIAKTYPQKPKDNIIPPKKPGKPES